MLVDLVAGSQTGRETWMGFKFLKLRRFGLSLRHGVIITVSPSIAFMMAFLK